MCEPEVSPFQVRLFAVGSLQVRRPEVCLFQVASSQISPFQIGIFETGPFQVCIFVFLLLFGLLFVVFIGGTTGWISFGAASLATFIIAGVGIDKIK